MRKIEVIFSQVDKELVEKLRHKYEKISNRCHALAFVFKIITGIILSGMLYFMTLSQ